MSQVIWNRVYTFFHDFTFLHEYWLSTDPLFKLFCELLFTLKLLFKAVFLIV